MRTNQKYFACTDDGRRARRRRSCASPTSTPMTAAQAIVEGNARVLAARLADARFFWEQDLKVPLEEQAKKLDGIVFHEKLGTVADKVERVAKLARWLVEEGDRQRRGRRTRSNARARPGQGRPRHRHGRRIPRAAGRHRRLSRRGAGRAARRSPTPSATITSRSGRRRRADAPVTVAVALADKLDTICALLRDRAEADRVEGSVCAAPSRARRRSRSSSRTGFG